MKTDKLRKHAVAFDDLDIDYDLDDISVEAFYWTSNSRSKMPDVDFKGEPDIYTINGNSPDEYYVVHREHIDELESEDDGPDYDVIVDVICNVLDHSVVLKNDSQGNLTTRLSKDVAAEIVRELKEKQS